MLPTEARFGGKNCAQFPMDDCARKPEIVSQSSQRLKLH